MAKFEVGQKVVIHHRNVRPPLVEEREVSRVGRKLVYVVALGREVAFRIAEGDTNDNYGHSHIYTLEEWADRARRLDLTARLHRGGLGFYAGGPEVPLDRLERIVAILEGGSSS